MMNARVNAIMMLRSLRVLALVGILLYLPALAQESRISLLPVNAPASAALQVKQIPAQESLLNAPLNSAQPAISGKITQTDYLLGAGDLLDIDDAVMGSMIRNGRLLSDGGINLPLIGKVLLGGLSLPQARERLSLKYAQYFTQPRLTIRLVQQHPLRVYVTGAVANPGMYLSGKDLRPENLPQAQLGSSAQNLRFSKLYLTDALILAGGLSQNANVRDVRIHRSLPESRTEHVNLMALFSQGNPLQDLSLQDQDVIEVEPLPENTLIRDRDWETFTRNNVATGAFKVSVLGSVTKPGAYPVQSADTVLTAIAKAGGFSDEADRKRIMILHTTEQGQVIYREMDLRDKKLLATHSLESWAGLLPDDVVFVNDSNARKLARFGKDLVVDRASYALLFPLFNNWFNRP